jgi:hypothetical protein
MRFITKTGISNKLFEEKKNHKKMNEEKKAMNLFVFCLLGKNHCSLM